jgi:hypothetical protein
MKVSSALAIALISLGAILCTKSGLFSPLAKHPPISPVTLEAGNGAAAERDYSPEEDHESNGPEGSAGSPMERLPIVYWGAAAIILICVWRLSAEERKASKG